MKILAPHHLTARDPMRPVRGSVFVELEPPLMRGGGGGIIARSGLLVNATRHTQNIDAQLVEGIMTTAQDRTP